MSEQIHPAITQGECVESKVLAEQLGSAEELTQIAPSAFSQQIVKIQSLPALREFLIHYKLEVLGPTEFDYIFQAYQLGVLGHARELIELDRKMSQDVSLKELKIASHHVGRRQLARLRPLRDMKVIQRYLKSIEEGQAFGWHTLVYGLVLSTYSLPLRQGLVHYGQKTIEGFIYAAARSLDLTEMACRDLKFEISLGLPSQVQLLIESKNLSDIREVK
ncbi:MAG: urease accessory UreF family protein [Verrucomicrobiales bacterium]